MKGQFFRQIAFGLSLYAGWNHRPDVLALAILFVVLGSVLDMEDCYD